MLDRAQLSPLKTVALGVSLALSFSLALATSACSKTESQGSVSTADTAPAAPPSAAPSAAAPAAREASGATEATDADAPTAATTTADATTTAAGAKTPASAAVAASAAPGPAACGKKPLPDCPLQGWMKANTTPAVSAKDMPALATALDKIATFAPPGYTNWASIAKDGAKAARADDMTAAKASCRTCHDQYKKKYKTELRDRKI